MAETFVALLTAHLLGYFIFHPEWAIRRRRRIWALVLRAAIVTSASYVLLGTFHWRILSAILLANLVLAAIEVYGLSGSLASLLADQFAHFAVLVALACYFPDTAKGGWWIAMVRPDLSRWYFASLSFISGVILCVPAGGILIAGIMRRFSDEIRDSDIAGLTQGGQYIGWLERFLVMLFLSMDQPNGIGFLIAAKSMLRFSEIKEPGQRKVAEYVIIGTFLSFGWALLVSLLTQKALRYWIP